MQPDAEFAEPSSAPDGGTLQPTPIAGGPWRRIVSVVFSTAWVLNAGLLIAVAAWMLCDSQFMEPVRTQVWPFPAYRIHDQPMSSGRLRAIWLAGALAATTIGIIAAGLFCGSPRHRGLRAWLGLTAIVACWLGLVTAWPTLVWTGRQWRAKERIDAFEPLAVALRDDWPTHDGTSDLLGPYSAYPPERPRVLMPLAIPPVHHRGAEFATIERSDAGALRFQLRGSEAGAWLEWHPPGSAPASFIGGLDVRYTLQRSSDLGRGWYLAKYRHVPAA